MCIELHGVGVISSVIDSRGGVGIELHGAGITSSAIDHSDGVGF